MKEKDIQNAIRLGLSKHAVVFRANVGTFMAADGRYISTGLPKGYSDLHGFRRRDGKAFFIEVKGPKGRLRKEQKEFLESMQKCGALAGVARSVEEALRIIEEA